MKFTIDIEGIGPVTIQSTRRNKSLSLRINRDGEVHASTPIGTTQKQAIDFVRRNIEWIIQAREKVKQKAIENGDVNTIFTPDTQFHTYEHKLQMIPDATDNMVHCREKPPTDNEMGVMMVHYPPTVDPCDEQIQACTRKYIEMILKAEALKHLPGRTAALAKANGLSYGKISVRSMRGRWGHCSANGDICFNIHLMRLPQALIDYVILHELAHTVVFDHSPKFKALLDKLCLGKKALIEKELKKYHTRTY